MLYCVGVVWLRCVLRFLLSSGVVYCVVCGVVARVVVLLLCCVVLCVLVSCCVFG